MPPYRLPLELELHILELATPPLLIDRVSHRVDFLRQIALVHRSFTMWAQDKLHEQFIFTFRGRVSEKERLQERLTAGFESPSSGKLLRLYLDTRAWSEDGKWKLDRFVRSDNGEGGSQNDSSQARGAVGQGDDALSGPWSAEHLEIDDRAWPAETWSELSLVAPASLTSLVLRFVNLRDSIPSLPNLQVLVLIRSYIRLECPEVLTALPNLDVFESIASKPALHPNNLAFFRPFARTARFYQRTCPDPEEIAIIDDASPPTQPPRLEACTFTWLAASPVSSTVRDPLDKLRAALAEQAGGTPLTVECVRSKATEEEMIERVLAELVV